MKKQVAKKVTLHRETITNLDAQQLGEANGGWTTGTYTRQNSCDTISLHISC